ncbi:MAG TPA: helicase-related protein, partial [Paenibacillaceae bacterium]
EADRRFWLDPVFRRGVLEEGGERGQDGMDMAEMGGLRLAVLGEPLPLGVAEAAGAWLEERAAAGRNEMRKAGTDEEVLILLKEAADVCRRAADEAAKMRPDFHSGVPAGFPFAAEPPLPRGAVMMTPAGQRWEEGEGIRRDLGRRLGRLARRAAECLAGQSLLPEEAQRVFADELTEMKREEWLLAVQTASLLRRVELRAALKPRVPAGPRTPAGPRILTGGILSPPLPGRLQVLFYRLTGRRARNESLRCRRCGSGEENMRRSPCAACGRVCAVCETCLTMGRCRECELLIIGRPERRAGRLDFPEGSLKPLLDRWKLSPAQREASAQALAFIRGNLGRPAGRFETDRRFLLWAVTGAGKTEMIFPLLDAVLSAGGRALVATPRRDVVLELAPRLARAFGEDILSVRYGGSPGRKRIAPLTLATTHQLLRYQEAFDLVLIDELDAFPFHGDPMLQFAADKARRPDGVTVLLTATPPHTLQRDVRRGQLPCARVPVRYHGFPLPEPRRLRLPELSRMLRTGRLPARLVRALRRSVAAGSSVFVFVPYVRQAEAFAELLRRHASELGLEAGQIAGTSSRDADRGSKVQAFRNREVRLLVATTILERGVTVPRSDVFILDADNAMFDETALVQMAGRAGRSAEAPDGRVMFAGRHMTSAQRRAIRHIRGMNRLARKKGYLARSLGRERRVEGIAPSPQS